jgi:hypothetical protein
MAWGARLSLVKGVGAGRAKARWRLRAPSGAPAQRRRVRGRGKGTVAVVNLREKRWMEEFTRYGPSTAACAGRGTPPTTGRRASRGHRL